MTSEFTLVKLKVLPNSKHEVLEYEGEEGEYIIMRIKVRAKAEDGKANQAVIKTITSFFDIPSRQVVIQSGHTSRNKWLRIYLPKTQILKQMSVQLSLC